MERQSERVDRCLEQLGIDVLVEDVECAIGRDEHAVRARDHGRIREVAVENRVERATHRAQRRIVERGLRERRGEAGGAEQVVALPQGQLHRVREPRDDSGARTRASLLDEAHVSLGGVRPRGQLELAQPACLPCSLQVRGELVHHVSVVPEAGRRGDSLSGIAVRAG